ncbi:unnamed protein product [Protopolystoma xenopodis]|uniref:Uncharacterized protein n=1 Tax=Protopolystoma xenopodis TaxID=117903 RepID=A0A448X466_9PLAT|nr:unnamed protein product [Protopolystoma xenopodis]
MSTGATNGSHSSSANSKGKKTGKPKPVGITSKRAAALEAAEEAAGMIPLQINNLKETRALDEKKRKVGSYSSHFTFFLIFFTHRFIFHFNLKRNYS